MTARNLKGDVMKKLGAILLLVAIATAAAVNPGEAGWKKRGWYLKRQDAECVMRRVTVVTGNGRVVVQKIRVCR
jgi:hypothetical protein